MENSTVIPKKIKNRTITQSSNSTPGYLSKENENTNQKRYETSLVVQWLRPHASTAGVMGSIPGQGTKIPHAMWRSQKKKKRKDTCTLMLIAALFTIAKIWKQLKCPSTDERIKKMWYIYTMEYYSAIKKRMKSCHL